MKVVRKCNGWTKKGSALSCLDDCVKEATEVYNEINPDYDWEDVNDEDRKEAAEIANNAIEKMIKSGRV